MVTLRAPSTPAPHRTPSSNGAQTHPPPAPPSPPPCSSPPLSPAVAAPRPHLRDDCGTPGWTPSATRIDPADTYHPYVGNGYLGTRVPPAGAGYAASGEKTGWPLYTPRYDGAFVSGLYARGPANTAGREALAGLPNWTGLDVTAGAETYGDRGRISHYRQALDLRCGSIRTSLTWTTTDGRRTDLVYDVLAARDAPHTGAVRLRVTPHWDGRLTLTDRLDGRGARRITQTDGGHLGDHTIGVAFRTDGTGVDGAVASVLDAPGRGQRAREQGELSVSQASVVPVRSGHTYTATKYVGVDTTLTSSDPGPPRRTPPSGPRGAGGTRCSPRTPPRGGRCGRRTSRCRGSRISNSGSVPPSTGCCPRCGPAPGTASRPPD